MNTRPMTPPQSAANSGRAGRDGGERQRSTGSPTSYRPRRARTAVAGRRNVGPRGRRARFPRRQLARVQRDLLGDDRQAEARPRRRRRRPRANGSRRRSRSSGGMPGPSSSTGRASVSPRADRPTRTCPPRAVQRRVVEEVVHQQAQAAVPAADHGVGDRVVELVCHPGVAASRGVHRGVDEVGELDVLAREALGGVARARAWRPSSRWTIRSCSAACRATSAARSASGRSGLRPGRRGSRAGR